MKRFLVGLAMLCLLVPTLAFASETYGGSATVVSVNLKAQSITFLWDSNWHSPKQQTAKWNEKTKWVDGTEGFANRKAVSADLVKSFKKGAPIYVDLEDGLFVNVVLDEPRE